MDLHTSGRSRWRAPVAAAVALLVIAAGCSGKSDKSSSSTSSAASATSASATTPAVTEAPTAPGFIFGFLQPAAGLATELGNAQRRALDLAVADINAGGGVNGSPVAVVTADEPASGDIGAAVGDLVDQGAKVIVGPVGSAAATAMLPSLTANGMIACSASATAVTLTDLDTDNRFYRTSLADDVTVALAADRLTALRDAAPPEGRAYKVSILARSDDYGVAVGNGLASALVGRGFEVNVVGYNPHAVIFTDEVATIAAQKADHDVVVSYGESPRILDTMINAGIPAASISGLDSMLDPRLAQATFPSKLDALDGLTVLAATGDRAFIDRLVAGAQSGQIVYGPQMYDCAIIAALAANAAGSNAPDGYGPQINAVTNGGRACSTFADCVAKLKSGEKISYAGAIGNVAFDDKGDPAHARYTTAIFRDGGTLAEQSSQDVDLTKIRQQEALASAVFITRLQQALTALGFYQGPIDGIDSPELTAAIAALQTSLGLPATGEYDAATDAALRARLGGASSTLDASISDLQQALTDLGFYKGPIDGRYSAETIAAVKAFQRSLGVPETGIIDVATLQAAYAQGAASVPPSTVPETAPPTVPETAPQTTLTPATLPITVPPAAPSLLEALKADPQFSTFVDLLAAAGYNGDAASPGPLTVFAPTNDAFAALPAGELDALKADPARLNAVLGFHVLEAKLTTEAMASADYATVNGAKLTITVSAGVITVGGAGVVGAEVLARNGVIHAIDQVLTPPA